MLSSENHTLVKNVFALHSHWAPSCQYTCLPLINCDFGAFDAEKNMIFGHKNIHLLKFGKQLTSFAPTTAGFASVSLSTFPLLPGTFD